MTSAPKEQLAYEHRIDALRQRDFATKDEELDVNELIEAAFIAGWDAREGAA